MSAFVTFESEEGHGRATQYDDIVNSNPKYECCKSLLGQPFTLKDASEPTDIIWENRSFTPQERESKRAIVGLIIFVLLFVSFIIILFFQKTSLKLKGKYGEVNCQTMIGSYENREDFFQTDAINEFLVNKR